MRGVDYQNSTFPHIEELFVAGFLGEGQQAVEIHRFRVIDFVVADDHIGTG